MAVSLKKVVVDPTSEEKLCTGLERSIVCGEMNLGRKTRSPISEALNENSTSVQAQIEHTFFSLSNHKII